MRQHRTSTADRQFLTDFLNGQITPTAFDHRAHLRLAYVLLVEDGDAAYPRFCDGIVRFLAHHGLPQGKFHVTLTQAWLQAVQHFMMKGGEYSTAEAFIRANPVLLEPEIMTTHYSPARLFSTDARQRFLPPDLEPIPEHEPQASP